MEGDRGAALIVEAALLGAVDFSTADPSNPRWWRKLKLITDALQRRLLGESWRRQLDIHLAVLSRDTSAEAAKTLLAQCQKHAERVDQALLPWTTADAKASGNDAAIDSLYNAWIAKYGKMDDPETQAKIAATVAFMNRKQAPGQG